MAYVNIPKDLNEVQTKLAFGLTRRQIVCFGAAAVVAVPVYLLTHKILGNDLAALLIIALAVPFFVLAMYRKDGMPLEKVLRNYARVRFLLPRERPYRTDNKYAALERQIRLDKEVARLAERAAKDAAGHQAGHKAVPQRPAQSGKGR